MKLSSLILFFALFVTAQTSPPPTEDSGARKAKALVDQTIQALGGPAYLSLQSMEQQGRTYGFNRGEPAGAGAPFWRFWKWPDKDRVELTKQRDWIIIHTGDNGYEITFKGTASEEPQALQDYLRRRDHSLEYVLRKWIKEPGVAFFYDGPVLAERKAADSVTILNAQNDAVTLYIDSYTHLPIKKVFKWRDPADKEKNEEVEVYDNYRSVQGIMTPHSTMRQHNGMSVNQRFIATVTYNQNLPDSLFDAQVTRVEKKK